MAALIAVYSRLVGGDFGLPKTFWLFGVLGGLVLGVPIEFSAAAGLRGATIFAVLFSLGYSLIVFIGIWRASGRYQGSIIWSVLARAFFVLGMLWLVRDFVVVLMR